MKTRRRNREDGHANHERWLVSYADFITLLFAFFVVMFASSQTDRQRVVAAGESVKKAFSDNHVSAMIANVLGGTVGNVGQGNAMMRGPGGIKPLTPLPQADPAELLPSMQYLDRELSQDIKAGRMSLHMESRGLVVSLHEASYFVSGDDAVSPAIYPVLEKVTSVMAKMPNPIRLEGHTDSVPIHNSRFKSNWELAAARSIAMLEALNKRFNVPLHKMAVVGYADSFPVESNETVEGRAKNRRVDIVILSRSGLVAQPETIAQKDVRAAASSPAAPSTGPAKPAPDSPKAPASR